MQYAEYNDISVIDTYIDRALTAKTDNRPNFQKMIKIDVSKQDGKRKIIDTFINAIYVSDDNFKIVYNVNGKEETIKLEELESSTLFSNGAPKKDCNFDTKLQSFLTKST